MTAPEIRGWCPSAYRPMSSGDGLVVRVRAPWTGLTRAQGLGLAALSERHGSGVIETTSRANIQLRGVSDAAFPQVLDSLRTLGLVDPDPAREARRNIVVAPLGAGLAARAALAERLADAISDPAFAGLPSKFGFAVDSGATRELSGVSADIRVERGASGLIVRADGAKTGCGAPDPAGAVAAACALAAWFLASGGVGPDGRGRMARHLAAGALLPERFRDRIAPRVAAAAAPRPRLASGRALVGAAFGQIAAADLAALADPLGQEGRIVVTPFRLLVVPHRDIPESFVTDPHDPRFDIRACPGAPACAQGTVATRPLAHALAARSLGDVHVSGCAKGCAYPRAAALTLTGRDGAFDLVRSGAPWDEPERRGLAAADVLKELGS